MDYSSLIETVEAAMNRSDITARIPGFIQRVEEEVNTRLASAPVRPMIKTYTLPARTERIDLPADFIDSIELTATDGATNWPLARLEPTAPFDYYAKALAPGLTYNSGQIQHYRILGDTLVLSAPPNPPFDLILDCYTKLDPINVNNSSNWLMDNHADVYQFGTLAHAAQYVRDNDFYNQNRELFLGALDMVALAYPEQKREIARRVTDAPWSAPKWALYG
jgi:hypothetical protein